MEDGMHEIHHDVNKEELKVYMLQWLKKRLERNPRNIGKIFEKKILLKKIKKIIGDFNTLRKGLRREDRYTKSTWGLIIIFI